jgi:maltose O-acetyltransferase
VVLPAGLRRTTLGHGLVAVILASFATVATTLPACANARGGVKARMTTRRSTSGAARSLVRSLREDLAAAARLTWFNAIGGSVLVPRALRWVLYRLGGHRIETPNIADHCWLIGRAKLTIGPRTYVNRFVFFDLLAPISIGADCQIAQQVMFCTSTHATSSAGFARTPSAMPVRVGNRCWLGARVTVLPGVRIGDDCIVAAGAVVTRDCSAGGVYAGIPARRLRNTFDERAGASGQQ